VRNELRSLGYWLTVYKLTTQPSGQHAALVAVAEKLLELLGEMVAKIETLEEKSDVKR